MHRFDVLDKNHSLLEPHFLEASAGTGKTFAIEHIVTRLLLDPNLNALGQDILVVTFTRASTRELKVRIRENLLQVLERLKKNEPTLDYLKPFLEKKENTRGAIKKIEQVLASCDLMEIYTIHGFCHQMLKEYPFEAKFDLEGSYDSIYSESEIYQQTVLDFLRVGLTEEFFHKNQIKRILKKERFETDKIASQIISHLKKDSLIEPPEFFSELKQKVETFLIQTKNEFLTGEGFKEAFLELAPLFKGICNIKKVILPHFKEQVDLFANYLDQNIDIEDFFSNLFLQQEFFFEFYRADYLKKVAKVSFEELAKTKKFLKFCERIALLLAKGLDHHYQILSMTFLAEKNIQKVLEEHGITPADFFLKIVRERLNETAFYEKLRSRYKAALIDEFQDTDPTQFEIFRKMFIENRKGFPLFLVGDPKQSIYAFRNADLPTYLKALSYFEKKEIYSLDTNYRSEPQLIKALNTLFTFSPNWLCERNELRYDPVEPSSFGKNTVFQDEMGPLHFIFAESEGKQGKDGGLKEVEEEAFFPFFSKEIKKFVSGGLNYESFAILIRDKFQGQRLERFLKREKIPFQATVKIPLVETEAFTFFEILVDVICNKDNIGLIKQLLISPIIGLSHHHLRKDLEYDVFLKALFEIKRLITLFEEKGFLEFWQAFLKTSFMIKEPPLEIDLLERKQRQTYFDLMQIADIIVQRHQRVKISDQELKKIIRDIKESDPEEEGSLCRRPDAESSGVHIMTIHKSKGLEFKIVFALGLCVRSKAFSMVIKTKKSDRFALEVLDHHDPDHLESLRGERLEKMRQLYVALTRAKVRVYIPYFFSEIPSKQESPIELFCKTSFSKEGLFSKEHFLKQLESAKEEGITFSFEKSPKTLSFVNEEIKLNELVKPLVYEKKFRDLFTHSFSSLRKETLPSLDKVIKEKKENLMPSSAQVGEIFHAILEKVFERGLYHLNSHQAIALLVKQEIAYTPLENFENEVLQIILEVYKIPLVSSSHRFTLSCVNPSHIQTEMEFLLEDNNQLYTGIIDLFFIYDKKYYLIDWKSNALQSYDRSDLDEAMKSHGYYDQAKLYMKAAKKYLAKKNLNEESFGGMFYLFIRGLNESSNGVVYLS